MKIPFYVLSATIDRERERERERERKATAARGGYMKKGWKNRGADLAPSARSMRDLKKRGGDPVKTRLTRSSSSYYDEGLHLLTRTTAPLLITQSSGRRLRSAERPAPTPSPPTSTSTSTSATTPTPTLTSPIRGRGSYDTSMLSI